MNNVFKSLGIKCRARSVIGSRIKITRDEGVNQNVFLSRHFLMLCGFSFHQLNCVLDSYRSESGVNFNLSSIIGFAQ